MLKQLFIFNYILLFFYFANKGRGGCGVTNMSCPGYGHRLSFDVIWFKILVFKCIIHWQRLQPFGNDTWVIGSSANWTLIQVFVEATYWVIGSA